MNIGKLNQKLEEYYKNATPEQVVKDLEALGVEFKHKEYILCAAVWYDDKIERPHLPRNIQTGMVVAGWRHFNCIHQLIKMFCPNWLKIEQEGNILGEIKKNSIQGFLTSKGNFVDRNTAGQIAFESGQYKSLKTLYSEDLY